MQEIIEKRETGDYPTAFRPTAMDPSLRPPSNTLAGTVVRIEEDVDLGNGPKDHMVVKDDDGKLGDKDAEWSLRITGKILEDKYAAARSQGLKEGYKVAVIYDGKADKAAPGKKPANLWRLFMEAPNTDEPPF